MLKPVLGYVAITAMLAAALLCLIGSLATAP